MSLELAGLIVSALGAYVAIGTVFALLFVTFGVGSIDPTARKMALKTRLIIFPGAIGLWPLMLVKLLTQKEPPVS